MSKARSIDETNALNKPVKGYRTPVKPKVDRVERTVAANYRKLSLTPSRIAGDVISSQAQFGQPPKDLKRSKTVIPQRVSNQPKLQAESTSKAPASTQINALKASPTRPKKVVTPTESSARMPTRPSQIAGNPVTKTFHNKFDNPLTKRELDQLRLAQLQGKDQKITQDLLKRLLNQSQSLAQQLAPQKPTAIRRAYPPSQKSPAERMREEVTQKLLDAQEDLRYLEQDYPKAEGTEQTTALTRLRDKYKAGKKSNTKQIHKLIQDELTRLREELQSI